MPNKPLRDLIELIHFTEHVSTLIHGILHEQEIFQTINKEFARTKHYTASIALLTADELKLKPVEVSIPIEKIKTAEESVKLRLKTYEINLEKSTIYNQVIKKGKTLHVRVFDIINELFPKPLASLILKKMGYENKKTILTPLKRQGKIIGVFAMTSTNLAKYLIPSVKNLSQHISNALELADECAKRQKAEEVLKRAYDDLEEKVRQRTSALSQTNALLRETIIKHQRANQALRESEERFKNILQSANDCIVFADKHGKILDVNEKGVEMYGGQKKELIGRTITKLTVFAPSEIKRVKNNLEKVLAQGKNYLNIYLKNKAGQKLYLDCSASTIKVGNKVVGLMLIARDVTQRKQAEEALRESEEKYRNLIERANDGIAIIQNGIVKYANPRLAVMGGQSPSEIIGSPFTDYVHPKDLPQVIQRYQKRMAGQKTESAYEAVLQRKDGSKVFYAELNAGTITYQGNTADLVIIRDITERKRTEKELEKKRVQLKAYSESLEKTVKERTEKLNNLVEYQREFIADIGHELRTPLSVIKAVVESELDNKTPQSKQFLLVDKKVDQIAQIIKNLMLSSRLDIGQESLQKTTFNLKNLLEETIHDVIGGVRKENINPKVKLHCHCSIKLSGDRIKTRLVLTNLLRNAIVHSNGKPQIALIATKINGLIRITVEDNNQAIPKAELRKIFERFYRGKQVKKGSAGSGLGLYICRKLVNLMGGKIWAESKKEIGNKFIVQLPISQ